MDKLNDSKNVLYDNVITKAGQIHNEWGVCITNKKCYNYKNQYSYFYNYKCYEYV